MVRFNFRGIEIIFLLVSIGFFQSNTQCTKSEKINDFPLILQESAADCGPVCLQMIGKYYGIELDLSVIREAANTEYTGTSLLGLSDASTLIGLKGIGVELDYSDLFSRAPLPAIIHWKGNHFVVVYEITSDSVWVADPEIGRKTYAKRDFCYSWSPTEEGQRGVALLFEKE